MYILVPQFISFPITPGSEVVVEELLTGPEISVLAFSDGYTVVPLPAAQDHKRIGEGDTGPNTGGMGAYAPAPVATPEIMDRIMKESLQPTIAGMRREGRTPSVDLSNVMNTLLRIPFPRHSLHRFHAHSLRAQGLGI